MKSSDVKPYRESELSKKGQITKMFNSIAWRYDFLNRMLSFGIDRNWRRKAIRFLKEDKPQVILDVATGTADLAIEAARLKPQMIYGIDLSADMLAIGREKIRRKNLQDMIHLLEVDSEDLVFEDNKFDAVTVAFGVRNFQDVKAGLGEMLRVLKPGGKAIILEFSHPENPIIRFFSDIYCSKFAPFIGKLVSRDKSAYTYLNESVKAFPYGVELCNILREVGFRQVMYRPVTFGVATIYVAEK